MAKCISDPVFDPDLMLEDIGVILKEFYPPIMPPIQFLLGVEIFKGFII